MNKHFIILIITGIVLVLVSLFGRSVFTGMVISPAPGPKLWCDPTLWNHVFNRTRLQIIDNCTSVTGTVISSFEVNDGDQHIQLLPDRQYLKLLNKKNIELQFGSLVIEPICSHDPTIINNSTVLDAAVDLADGAIENDSIAACRGYVREVNVYIPKVGEHVRVTGSYVLDTLHGWMEIHPVTQIEVIK